MSLNTASPSTSAFPAGGFPVVVAPQPAPPQTPVLPPRTPVLPTQPVEPARPLERGPTDRRPLQRDCVRVWDVPFDRLSMRQSVDRVEQLIARREPAYVITANVNYCMLHHQDERVRRVTEDAALILADGQPIVWRSRLTSQRLPERVPGSEMIDHLCRRAAEKKWQVYFLGGEAGVARAAAERLQRRHVGLQVAGTESPPFTELTAAEQAAQEARIRDAGTDLLLVALGQPKGERWIHERYQRLGVPVSIQLGASFDFLAGTATRAPQIYQRLGMEWAYRMFSDPKRLVPRYAANAAFLSTALWTDWKRQVTAWGMGEWDHDCST